MGVKDFLCAVLEAGAAAVCVGGGTEAADAPGSNREDSKGVRGRAGGDGPAQAPHQPHRACTHTLTPGVLVQSKPSLFSSSWVEGDRAPCSTEVP